MESRASASKLSRALSRARSSSLTFDLCLRCFFFEWWWWWWWWWWWCLCFLLLCECFECLECFERLWWCLFSWFSDTSIVTDTVEQQTAVKHHFMWTYHPPPSPPTSFRRSTTLSPLPLPLPLLGAYRKSLISIRNIFLTSHTLCRKRKG